MNKKKFLKTIFLTILCIALFTALSIGIFVWYMYFIYFGPHVSVNKLLKEIETNPNVEKIEDYLQDDERYEKINATIKLKNGLKMHFSYIRREDGKLVFQDAGSINGYAVIFFIYKKNENTYTFSYTEENYLYPTNYLDDWLENSEAIYEKLLRLPLTEYKYEKSKEFFDSLQTDFVEETDMEIRKYFKWKTE